VKRLENGFWLVTDGPTAWRYDQDGLVQVRDAQECDPKLHETFLKAEEKVARAKPASAIVHDLLMKEILLRNYHLHWNTPHELWPLNRRSMQ